MRHCGHGLCPFGASGGDSAATSAVSSAIWAALAVGWSDRCANIGGKHRTGPARHDALAQPAAGQRPHQHHRPHTLTSGGISRLIHGHFVAQPDNKNPIAAGAVLWTVARRHEPQKASRSGGRQASLGSAPGIPLTGQPPGHGPTIQAAISTARRSGRTGEGRPWTNHRHTRRLRGPPWPPQWTPTPKPRSGHSKPPGASGGRWRPSRGL